MVSKKNEQLKTFNFIAHITCETGGIFMFDTAILFSSRHTDRERESEGEKNVTYEKVTSIK